MGRHQIPKVNVAKGIWNRAANLLVSVIAAAEACGYRLEQDENGKYLLKVFESRIQIAIQGEGETS